MKNDKKETMINSLNDEKQDTSKNFKLINKNYLCHLNNVIGSGTFGKVLYCTTIDGKTEYAIKFEKSTVKSSVIEIEYEIYEHLQGGEGVPKIAWIGEYKKYKLMVMELLGPSLDKYFIYCQRLFSPVTTAMIGIEMVKRIQYIHSRGFLHRDIKPNNFMLGKFSKTLEYVNDKTVYVIDFGLSKEYIDFETGEHLPFKDGRRFIGTPRYASIGTHLGYRQSRRDDIESIAYILIYFMLGDLPWQGVKAKSKGEKKEKILEIKLKTNFSADKRIPKELLTILEYSKNLKYEEKPDYKLVYGLLSKVLKNNISDYSNFDTKQHLWEWNIKMLTALESENEYTAQHDAFKKLFDGYPVNSFDLYIKKIKDLNLHNSNNRIPTTSSTTSNTNPSVLYQHVKKDESDDEADFIEKSPSKKKEIQLSKLQSNLKQK